MISSGLRISMLSSELPELLGLSDRVYVMHNGKINACLDRDQMDQQTVLNYAFGVNGK